MISVVLQQEGRGQEHLRFQQGEGAWHFVLHGVKHCVPHVLLLHVVHLWVDCKALDRLMARYCYHLLVRVACSLEDGDACYMNRMVSVNP